jgi:hypothetical protein
MEFDVHCCCSFPYGLMELDVHHCCSFPYKTTVVLFHKHGIQNQTLNKIDAAFHMYVWQQPMPYVCSPLSVCLKPLASESRSCSSSRRGPPAMYDQHNDAGSDDNGKWLSTSSIFSRSLSFSSLLAFVFR